MPPSSKTAKRHEMRANASDAVSNQRMLVLTGTLHFSPMDVASPRSTDLPTARFWAWVNGDGARTDDVLCGMFDLPVRSVITVKAHEVICNGPEMLLGFLLSDHLGSTDHLRFGHALSLLEGIDKHGTRKAVKLMREKFEVLVLCDDSQWKEEHSTAQVANEKMLKFASWFVEYGHGKCYPPVSRVRAMLNKPVRDAIMQKFKLPYEDLDVPAGFGGIRARKRMEQLSGLLIDKTLDKLSSDDKEHDSIQVAIDTTKLVFKECCGNGCDGVYFVGKGDNHQQWTVKRAGYSANDGETLTWSSLGGKRFRVEPYMIHLHSHEEHHFYVSKSGGMYGQPKLHVGYHIWSKFQEVEGITSRLLPEELCRPGFCSNSRVSLPETATKKWLREVLCCFQDKVINEDTRSAWDIDGLVFRVDFGVIRNGEGKVFKFYLNEIGLVPVEHTFVRTEQEISCLDDIAVKVAGYIKSHINAWPA